ncbi:hypothetical protein INT43_000232 [Umbelopsis isabellina]|uniref:P53 and DNA damage-regulated protein 1 n=1 Tax=Mortierella isabellina TaxID=91625 RepID=A0A8H7U920_MORIS|nr:hypothetical protein INT43_000232 [Umbelopsis isabellina]
MASPNELIQGKEWQCVQYVWNTSNGCCWIELAKKETLAEDILTDKQLIIDSDRKRNTNREALTNIRKKLNNGMFNILEAIGCKICLTLRLERKLWINMGDMFIKLPKEDVKNMIEEDQKKLDEEIESRRDMVRQKVMKLDQFDNGQQTSGFDLQGLKASDIYNIRNQKTQEREI